MRSLSGHNSVCIEGRGSDGGSEGVDVDIIRRLHPIFSMVHTFNLEGSS